MIKTEMILRLPRQKLPENYIFDWTSFWVGPLSETVNKKLQHIWEMAHYRYTLPKEEMKINSHLEKLSPNEKETLEDIAQVFGITVYVRTHKGGKLISLGNG